MDSLPVVDLLRTMAESSRLQSDGEYGPDNDVSRAIERAADYLEDVEDKLASAEDDIDRLNGRLLTYAANMATIRRWADWIAVESSDGNASRDPRDLLDAYPGITLVVPDQSPTREETTHE